MQSHVLPASAAEAAFKDTACLLQLLLHTFRFYLQVIWVCPLQQHHTS